MSKISIIDPNKTSQYLQHIWNPSYGLGLYFSGLQELGIYIYIDITLKVSGSIEHYRAFHALHDAYSALNTLNRAQGLDLNFAAPEVRPVKNRLRSLVSALRSKASQKLLLPRQRPYSSSTEGRWHTLEIPPLKAWQILNIVTKIAAKNLTDNTRLRWQVPTRIGNKPGMKASYFGLEVDVDESAQQTQREYKNKLQSDEHWGFFYLAHLGLILRKWGVRRATRKTLSSGKKVWFGSLSNLGNLGQSSQIEELQIHPAVRWHRPFGMMMYTFNEKSYVTLGLHESLQDYDLPRLVQEIHDALRS